MVKQALLNIAADTGVSVQAPAAREDWARLAQRLGIKVMHIAERDTQVANVAKMPIALHYGMKIGQLSFMRMSTPVDRPYGSAGLHSKYQGQMTPTPSRAHTEFDDQ